MAIAPAESPLAPKADSMAKDAEMMDVIKRKGKPQNPAVVEQAKEQIRQYITQNKIDPQVLIQVGSLCSQALKDPALYQMAAQMAIQNGITTKEELGTGINYKMLGIGITIGKLTKDIVDEGM